MVKCEGVFYRIYNEYTYVYHVKQKRRYLYNEIVYDILSILENDRDFSELCNELVRVYDVEDKAQFVMDISDFVNQLIEENIIVDYSRMGDGEESDLSEDISSICKISDQLEHVYLELTHRCNENCIHCYVHDSHGDITSELSTQEMYHLLDELQEMGVMQITITGGEPSIRKDFLQIIEYSSKRFVTNIYTNFLNYDNDIFLELVKMNINRISTSLYGATAETHDSVTQVSGSFDKTLKYLLMFANSGISVSVKTIVMNENEHEFERLIALLNNLNINCEVSLQLLVKDENDNNTKKLRLGDVEKYFAAMKKYYNTTPDFGCNVDGHKRGKYVCGVARSLNIDPYGNVFPCNALLVKIGNVKNKSISQLWNDSRLVELRKFNRDDLEDQCKSCDKFEFCLYCPGANVRENGSMSKHIEESCLIATAYSKLLVEEVNKK